jgi:hypothetical protein
MNSGAWKTDVEVGDLCEHNRQVTHFISYPVAGFYITGLNLPIVLPLFFL